MVKKIFIIVGIATITLINSCSKITNQENNSFLTNPTPKEITEEDLFEAEFIVATFDGDLKDGDELDLTFDKETFLDDYERTLINETQEEWTTENVRAFAITSDKEDRVVPLIQFSSYNVSKEQGMNSYYLLRPITNNKRTLISYTFSACDTNVVCTSQRPCGSESSWCKPHVGSDYLGCTSCPIAENCTEQSSINCGIARCIIHTLFSEKVMYRPMN